MQWDFIIIGAGSAGCAAAHELVTAGCTVLVIEAGGSDRSPFIKIPAGAWSVRPGHDWSYTAQPDARRGGRTQRWVRGKVLGGTSSINGTVYVRGAAEDYDRWSDRCAGLGGWSSDEVMSVFRSIENSDQVNDHRGRGGPLHVRTVGRVHPVTQAFIDSARAAGYPFNPDYNGDRQDGVGYVQVTQRRGLRWSAADAFLKPHLGKKNLQLRLNTLVEKIEMIDGRASGVWFRHRGKRVRESAKQIIVSAGVVNTPHLMMLSGIGDAAELEYHGIEVVRDLPAVGRHLNEHPLISMSYRSKIPTYNLSEGLAQKISLAAKFLRFREGPLACAYEATAFLKTASSLTIPDIQVFFAPVGWEHSGKKLRLSRYPAVQVSVVHSHANISGRIRLASADPAVSPLIECSVLESPADIDALIRGMEAVRGIMAQKPISDLLEAEIAPGPDLIGARSLRDYILLNAGTACHPMGTCRMGIGPDTVVSPELKVHGVENLWIADASIMPDQISANLNGPCMMIGAKLGRRLA